MTTRVSDNDYNAIMGINEPVKKNFRSAQQCIREDILRKWYEEDPDDLLKTLERIKAEANESVC